MPKKPTEFEQVTNAKLANEGSTAFRLCVLTQEIKKTLRKTPLNFMALVIQIVEKTLRLDFARDGKVLDLTYDPSINTIFFAMTSAGRNRQIEK